jgi:hypothetical protein
MLYDTLKIDNFYTDGKLDVSTLKNRLYSIKNK